MRRPLAVVLRFLRGLRRPSRAANERRLRARGEDPATSLRIRGLALDDVPALSRLHARLWADTYPGVRHPPTAELRERQWRKAFAEEDGWFCFVVERTDGALVGFAKGERFRSADLPVYAGQLSKIYLDAGYQRLGIGRRLMGRVARRFLEEGVTSMVLFADAANPSCGFYEAMGGERVREPDGRRSDSTYGWRDLRALAEACGG